jgi:hypothetical protein
MVPYESIRLAVVRGLNAYTGLPVIEMNGNGPVPKGDFFTYDFPGGFGPSGGQPVTARQGGKISQRETVTCTLQIMAYADDRDTALTNALLARDWFKLAGRVYLKETVNAVVVTVGEAENRDIAIEEEWERRQGFEVTLRTVDVTEMQDKDGFIEKGEGKFVG